MSYNRKIKPKIAEILKEIADLDRRITRLEQALADTNADAADPAYPGISVQH